jgi:hypothetical protein
MCFPHVCVCSASVDITGKHGISCRNSAGRLSGHSAENDLIKCSLSSAEIPSRLESISLARDNKQPDCSSLVPSKEGRCFIWDCTNPDTLAPSHLSLYRCRDKLSRRTQTHEVYPPVFIVIILLRSRCCRNTRSCWR